MAEPFTMVVELGKVREFARATGSTHPDHLSDERAISPITFLMSAAFWQSPRATVVPADRDTSRVLHGGQEFVFESGPPPVGAILTGRSHTREPVIKEGRRGGTMTLTEIVTEYRDETGAVIAEVTTTSIETSKPTGAR